MRAAFSGESSNSLVKECRSLNKQKSCGDSLTWSKSSVFPFSLPDTPPSPPPPPPWDDAGLGPGAPLTISPRGRPGRQMLDGHKSERGLGTRPGWEQVNLGRLEGQRWGFSLRSERMWAQVYILTRGHMALPAALLSTTATGCGGGGRLWAAGSHVSGSESLASAFGARPSRPGSGAPSRLASASRCLPLSPECRHRFKQHRGMWQ